MVSFELNGLMTVSTNHTKSPSSSHLSISILRTFHLLLCLFNPKTKNFIVVDMVDMVLLLLPHAMDNLWNTKGSGNFPGPKHKMVCQNHLGYDLNFKAPTDVILVASAAFSSLMFAVCIQILNFQHW